MNHYILNGIMNDFSLAFNEMSGREAAHLS